jgi:hypothetical protein
MVRSRSNGEDIMVVRCPVRCLGIVRRDRSCMLEQWATIHRATWEGFKASQKVTGVHNDNGKPGKPKDASLPCKTLGFITNAAGKPVDGYQAMAMHARCHRIWAQLEEQGHAPPQWTKAGFATTS